MYVTYRIHYHHGGNQLDYDPPTYSGIAFFLEEIAGLRWANTHSLKLIEVFDHETLDEAIRREARTIH